MLLVAWVRADTLTLRNNAELNGQVRYQDDAFRVTARYHSGTKTKTFHRAEVRTIEINGRDFNSGEPPTDISVFGDRSTATRDASQSLSVRKKKDKSLTEADQVKHPAHTVLTNDEPNPSTTDVIWLKDKQELTGRLVSIENGQLTFANGKTSKKFNLRSIAAILVAPD